MRTTDLADTKSWRAWDGTVFNVRSIDPYLEPDEPPQDHICQPLSQDEIQSMVESLTFNTYLDRYLLVGAAVERGPDGGNCIGDLLFSVGRPHPLDSARVDRGGRKPPDIPVRRPQPCSLPLGSGPRQHVPQLRDHGEASLPLFHPFQL